MPAAASERLFTDSHCHLSSSEFALDRAEAAARMHAAGVCAAIDMCCTLDEYEGILALSEQIPGLWASVGVHPEYGPEVVSPDADTLVRLADNPRVAAIGECGLDYFNGHEDHAMQARRFAAHIEASLACGKPLSVHVRDAMDDALGQLENHGNPPRFALHCFTGTPEHAQRILDMGGYLSFSGITTFRSARAVAEIARTAPLDRILTETDCPYLAPVPHRGHRNEPAFVADTARFIAGLRAMPAEDFARAVRNNFSRLFGITEFIE